MASMIITIDGPAGSGKSTVARELAERIGAVFLDTGAMYRAVTLAAVEKGLDMSSEQELMSVFDTDKFEFKSSDSVMRVWINGIEVTENIRSVELTAKVKAVAACGKVRERLVDMQREFARKHERVVTEGRDQGTVAFADADFKFFLDASVAQRAKRRFLELSAKGEQVEIKQIQSAIEVRDANDMSRTAGPLKPAEDAVVIDTTELDVEEVLEKILGYVKNKS